MLMEECPEGHKYLNAFLPPYNLSTGVEWQDWPIGNSSRPVQMYIIHFTRDNRLPGPSLTRGATTNGTTRGRHSPWDTEEQSPETVSRSDVELHSRNRSDNIQRRARMSLSQEIAGNEPVKTQVFIMPVPLKVFEESWRNAEVAHDQPLRAMMIMQLPSASRCLLVAVALMASY